SMQGFTDTMKELNRQERLSSSYKSRYLMTHPLTRERIRDIERFTKNTPPLSQNEQFDLIRAKLIGFLYPPEQTLLKYKGTSIADKYAKAIATYKKGKISDSLKQIDTLISLRPQNAYFYELKGQFLFETGQSSQSVKAYEKAISIMPDATLIRLALAQVLTESDSEDDLNKAIGHLTTVVTQDKSIPGAWRLLAIAYGKTGNIPMADYAMAEFYILTGDKKQAVKSAKRAIDKIKTDTPAYHHLQDILDITKTNTYQLQE
ncbi:MAG: tetratricopeptide repeat protein, partial [Alphaproteobacteria bacterium]|nr:tetratricopeptide repeat protein [Alphaproteobacteria bacterium]